jgi:hypothetical protein
LASDLTVLADLSLPVEAQPVANVMAAVRMNRLRIILLVFIFLLKVLVWLVADQHAFALAGDEWHTLWLFSW